MDISKFEIILDNAKKYDHCLCDFIERYKPLLIKNSIINDIFYEDLYSELLLAFIVCVNKFTPASKKLIE